MSECAVFSASKPCERDYHAVKNQLLARIFKPFLGILAARAFVGQGRAEFAFLQAVAVFVVAAIALLNTAVVFY